MFTRKEYKVVIADSLNYCIENKGLEVFAWCLMSNHIHLVCRAKEGFRISDIIRDFKKFTAKIILKMIEKEPESRKEWLIIRMKIPSGQWLLPVQKTFFTARREIMPERKVLCMFKPHCKVSYKLKTAHPSLPLALKRGAGGGYNFSQYNGWDNVLNIFRIF